jgi:CheY-like chemotaxis protein
VQVAPAAQRRHVARRALVVDDETSIRELVRLALEDEGWEVREAADGSQALHLLDSKVAREGAERAGRAGIAMHNWQPDVILLDMRMPSLDGWQFTRHYRERVARPAPIVCMTAAANAHAWAAEIGAAGLLAKPFELDDLLKVVEDAIRR